MRFLPLLVVFALAVFLGFFLWNDRNEGMDESLPVLSLFMLVLVVMPILMLAIDA